jgi:hypothetical protein
LVLERAGHELAYRRTVLLPPWVGQPVEPEVYFGFSSGAPKVCQNFGENLCRFPSASESANRKTPVYPPALFVAPAPHLWHTRRSTAATQSVTARFLWHASCSVVGRATGAASVYLRCCAGAPEDAPKVRRSRGHLYVFVASMPQAECENVATIPQGKQRASRIEHKCTSGIEPALV